MQRIGQLFIAALGLSLAVYGAAFTGIAIASPAKTDQTVREPFPAFNAADVPAGHKQAFFKVGGMCCAGCASGCSEAIGKIAGVDSASGDTTTGILVAVYDPGKVKEADIEAAIVKAGYTNAGRGQGGVWSRTKNSDGTVKVALEVRGMTCTGCSGSIDETVGKLAGVKSAKATHTAHACVVEYDPKKAKETDIVAAISKLGFTVSSDPLTEVTKTATKTALIFRSSLQLL